MTCRTVKLPEGAVAIVCSRGRSNHRCKCGRPARFQCDAAVPANKSGTCDAYICPVCALGAGVNRHLCPAHYGDARDRA